jgi:hypothetical protein
VLHPCVQEFFRCEAHYHLSTHPSVLGQEFDLVFADPDHATLGNRRTSRIFANADTKRPVHGDAIQKDYLRPAGEKIGLQGMGWHSFRHTYRTLIDDIGTPLGVQQRLMRHADIKTTMNTYGSAFEKTKRRANSRVADLVLPPAIKRQLKDSAKEVSLKNLRPETATIQ